MHNDLTLDDVQPTQKVFFVLKSADKVPTCITKVLATDTDDRDRPYANLLGIGWVPLYQVRPLTSEQLQYYPEPGPAPALPPVKGIDY